MSRVVKKFIASSSIDATKLDTATSGSNTQVLTRDSGESSGFKWASVTSASSFPFSSITSTYTAQLTDYTLSLSGASFTLTLPTAIGNSGKIFYIIHNGTSISQLYTLNTTGGQTIGGVTSGNYVLYTNGESLKIVSDGSNWLILEHRACTSWVDAGAITITGSTTNPTKATGIVVDKFWWCRNGQNLLGRFEYRQNNNTSAAAGSGDYLFQAVPSGITIDTSLLTIYTSIEGGGGYTDNNTVGNCGATDSGATGTGTISVYSTTQVRLMTVIDTAVGVVGSAFFSLSNAATRYTASFKVPISGWRP